MLIDHHNGNTCPQCGTPAHIGCDCMDTTLDQEQTVETRENARGGIAELKQLLEDDNFIEGFVSINTVEERTGIETAEKELITTATGELRILIDQQALKNLGREGEDLISVKKELKRAWGEAFQAVNVVRFDGKEYPLEKGSNAELLQQLAERAKTEQWHLQMEHAQQALEHGVKREKARLQTISEELQDRKDDSRLLAAMEVWGRSPNSSDDRGENNKGHHAGVVHYFEYRSSRERAGRFDGEKTPCGVEGFIEYTEPLQDILSNPTQDNAAIKRLSRFKDNAGQERLIVLTEDTLVVCFQNSGEPMRVISSIPQKMKDGEKVFEKARQKEVSMNPDEDTRLNKLADGREEVESW